MEWIYVMYHQVNRVTSMVRTLRVHFFTSSVTSEGDGFMYLRFEINLTLPKGKKLIIIFRSPETERSHWGGMKVNKYSKILVLFF